MNPIIPVFIGSPGDVYQERDVTERAVLTLAPRLSGLFGETLVPLRWEQFAPISSADASHPQIDILRRIEPGSIFIGILGMKYGTPLPKSGIAGTETEFNHALANRHRITILSYFQQDSTDENRDLRVYKLKRRLERKKVWIATYKDSEAFAQRIHVDLMEASLRMILSRGPTDLRRYSEFFRFGYESRAGSSPILIAYPSITESGPGITAFEFAWRTRLLPRVVFEDLKAVQDVEGIMRILNREYRTVTTDSPELILAPPGDRVWVCIPRNRKARDILAKVSTRSRFAFSRKKFDDVEELLIRWKRQDGTKVQVRSPLSTYLAHSKRPDELSSWEPLYGYTYGRDYGVLARFELSPGPPAVEGQQYYHYFLGGIRGLGTWGVGWFLDHCSQQLEQAIEKSRIYKAQEKNDVQILLEVIYENYRIVSVKDVSDEDQAFFDNRISEHFIRQQLKKVHPFS